MRREREEREEREREREENSIISEQAKCHMGAFPSHFYRELITLFRINLREREEEREG